MGNISTFKFNQKDISLIKGCKYGKDWPVVYFQENGEEAYIGEAVNVFRRSKEHLKNSDRQRLHSIHIIADDEYNKSATLDIESWLIQYLVADGRFKLQNGNAGLQNHSYYEREKYRAKFDVIWEEIRKKGLASQSLRYLQNTDLFKYSPYKALNDDQETVVQNLVEKIQSGKKKTFLVTGKPGTGKTILATYLIKYLKENDKTKDLDIALVIPMTGLRKTLKEVFGGISGLKKGMVIGPSDVARKKYDLVIVDEAHRLNQRKNLTAMGAFDNTNRALKLPMDATQLDWILKQSNQQILFYDDNQSVRPSDVSVESFKNLDAEIYNLQEQMRVQAGDDFIQFIADFFDEKDVNFKSVKNYELQIYEDMSSMVHEIKSHDKKSGLSRIVAGYAWEWHSRKDPSLFDIEIGGEQLRWNKEQEVLKGDWINSPTAVDEVGCIHTVQGYDLNYVGVIIGPELSYNSEKNKFVFIREFYKDKNGKKGVQDDQEVKRYVLNIYKTLLTRGIKGTYVYIVDDGLREHFRKAIGQKIAKINHINTVINNAKEVVSHVAQIIRIPLVGSAPCGNPLLGEDNIEEYIDVDNSKIKPGVKYFIVTASGDSMNKVGINDGDLVLCRYAEKGETGDRVVALLGGDNVTIKYYDKLNGRRVLLPKSTNPKHTIIIPEEGDEVQGIVQEVLE